MIHRFGDVAPTNYANELKFLAEHGNKLADLGRTQAVKIQRAQQQKQAAAPDETSSSSVKMEEDSAAEVKDISIPTSDMPSEDVVRCYLVYATLPVLITRFVLEHACACGDSTALHTAGGSSKLPAFIALCGKDCSNLVLPTCCW